MLLDDHDIETVWAKCGHVRGKPVFGGPPHSLQPLEQRRLRLRSKLGPHQELEEL